MNIGATVNEDTKLRERDAFRTIFQYKAVRFDLSNNYKIIRRIFWSEGKEYVCRYDRVMNVQRIEWIEGIGKLRQSPWEVIQPLEGSKEYFILRQAHSGTIKIVKKTDAEVEIGMFFGRVEVKAEPQCWRYYVERKWR